MRKYIITGTSTLVGIVSSFIFYSASAGNSAPFDFSANTALKITILALSGLVGINEFFEMTDHISHDHKEFSGSNDQTHLISEQETNYNSIDNRQDVPIETSPEPSCSPQQRLGKIVTTAAVSPFLLAAFYGLFLQSASLMESVGITDETTQQLFALIPAAILGVRFMAIPVMHTLKNIWGGHEEFTARVTGAQGKIDLFRSPKLRIPVFLIFCGTHLAEAALLSNEIKEGWIQILSIIGLTLGRAVAHLDHTDAMPNAYRDWRDRPSNARWLTAGTGLTSGVVHASPAIISAIYFWDEFDDSLLQPLIQLLMLASIFIESLTGTLEHQQHGGRYIAGCLGM